MKKFLKLYLPMNNSYNNQCNINVSIFIGRVKLVWILTIENKYVSYIGCLNCPVLIVKIPKKQ
ncbi:MAG: hypothetical protein LBT66_06060 [Methanobrevibacter sp.]|jgi:hypothetical protein|nr:hypothetical protein [Candidatus Methanovirga meridionalis]